MHNTDTLGMQAHTRGLSVASMAWAYVGRSWSSVSPAVHDDILGLRADTQESSGTSAYC